MSDLSEMLARVALVIQSFDGHALSDGVELGYDAIARAVLGAMREPTGAMVEAGYASSGHWDDETPYAVWCRMIEAALADASS